MYFDLWLSLSLGAFIFCVNENRLIYSGREALDATEICLTMSFKRLRSRPSRLGEICLFFFYGRQPIRYCVGHTLGFVPNDGLVVMEKVSRGCVQATGV